MIDGELLWCVTEISGRTMYQVTIDNQTYRRFDGEEVTLYLHRVAHGQIARQAFEMIPASGEKIRQMIDREIARRIGA